MKHWQGKQKGKKKKKTARPLRCSLDVHEESDKV